MERENVLVPDPENDNPVLHMIEYVINNYKGKPKIIINKHGKKMIWSYKYQFVGHNASAFDNYIVLKSIPKSYTSVKTKISRGFRRLSFRAGSVYEDEEEFRKHAKFVCSECHILGAIRDIQKEYKIQPQLLKREIAHDLIYLEKLQRIWKPVETLFEWWCSRSRLYTIKAW